MNLPTSQSSNYRQKIFVDSSGQIWKDVICDDGIYYYNIQTRETTWDKPADLVENNSLQLKLSCYSSINKPNPIIGSDYGYGVADESQSAGDIIESTPVGNSDWVCHKFSDGRKYYSNSKTFQTSWEFPVELYTKTTQPQTDQTDDNRPIMAEPIFGTVWYLVLTGDGKYFYYNRDTRISTFNMPPELEDNLSIEMIKESFQAKIKSIKSSTSLIGTNLINSAKKRSAAISLTNDQIIVDDEKVKKIDAYEANGENSYVAAENAAGDKSRNGLTHAQKVSLFEELLVEKMVSAFSTYDSELIKLEKDYRFGLLTSKDRKHVFNEYIRRRVEAEAQEKHLKIKEKYDIFNDFLKSVVKSSRMSYTDILMKYSNDSRFKSISKEKEREKLFQQYMSKFNKKISGVGNLGEDEGGGESGNSSVSGIKGDIFKMFDEIEQLDFHTPWRRVHRQIQNDPRFLKLNDVNKCQVYFDEYLEKKVEVSKLRDLERAKIEREKASIREREKNIKSEQDRAGITKSKEKRQIVRSQAIESFKVLLSELIHDPKISWYDAKRLLKNYGRFDECVKDLRREDYLDVFDDHLDMLNKKIVDSYYELLEEVGCDFKTSWEVVYPRFRNDPRCIKFSKNEKMCKNQFFNFIENFHKKAVENFQELLTQTKMIDHRFLAKAKLIPSLNDELIQELSKDDRYKALEPFKEERSMIINEYLVELQNKGT